MEPDLEAYYARQIVSLRGKHAGQRCFVIGNGPSLKIEDLDRLKGEYSFAANKIYLAFDETDWRPTYYFVADRLVAELNVAEIAKVAVPKFFPTFFYDILGEGDSTTYFNVLRGCRDDIATGVHCRATVISPMLQFAYYMGFGEIYLLGMDFSFDKPKSSGQKTKEDDDILVSAGEVNHFHPDYRKPGEQWTYPKLDLQREFFMEFRDFTQEREGHPVIFNASRQTKLDVFPCVDFDTLFL